MTHGHDPQWGQPTPPGPTPGGQGSWQPGWQPQTAPPDQAYGGNQQGPGKTEPPPPSRRGSGPGWPGVIAACLITALVGGGSAVAITGLTGSPRTPDQVAPVANAGSAAGSSTSVDWTTVIPRVASSVVNIQVADASGKPVSTGSGSVIDNQGHVLTNDHVATSGGTGSRIQISLTDGRVFDNVTLSGADKSTDLAVLKIENAPADLKPIIIGDSSQVVAGQPVMALGSPLGLADTATTGIVSAVDRPVIAGASAAGSASDLVITNAIQTDAAINPGNSGGALVDSTGALIGIPSSINTLTTNENGQGGSIGLGFAIPSNEAKRIAEELISTGKASHAWLGVGLTDGLATASDGKHLGAELTSVAANTPAQQAGLRKGDVVIAIDGTPIKSAEGLIAQIRERAPGDTVKLTYVRSDQTVTADVQLAKRGG